MRTSYAQKVVLHSATFAAVDSRSFTPASILINFLKHLISLSSRVPIR